MTLRRAEQSELNPPVDGDLQRLVAAVRLLPDAVVMVDDAGVEVMRSIAADRFLEARHTDAIAAAALEEMLIDACRGESSTRELQLYGPLAKYSPLQHTHLSRPARFSERWL